MTLVSLLDSKVCTSESMSSWPSHSWKKSMTSSDVWESLRAASRSVPIGEPSGIVR